MSYGREKLEQLEVPMAMLNVPPNRGSRNGAAYNIL